MTSAAGIAVVASLALLAIPAAGSSSPPRASLRGFICHHALEPSNREVSTTAVMRPVSGTRQMQLKFVLLSKTSSSGSFSPVPATGTDLGKWISPGDSTLGQNPGDVWIVDKPVDGVSAPAVYRFRVTFRWRGRHQHVLAVATRTTHNCYQPELRPDLYVKSITVEPIANAPNNDRYVAVIGNQGATAAGPFEVQFTQGNNVRNRNIHGLKAHATISVSFRGALCTSDTAPTVTVDPNDQVPDYNRSNNTMTATCPSGSGGNP